jgi:hypothetical protein
MPKHGKIYTALAESLHLALGKQARGTTKKPATFQPALPFSASRTPIFLAAKCPRMWRHGLMHTPALSAAWRLQDKSIMENKWVVFAGKMAVHPSGVSCTVVKNKDGLEELHTQVPDNIAPCEELMNLISEGNRLLGGA